MGGASGQDNDDGATRRSSLGPHRLFPVKIRASQGGFTLVELMVALALGLVVMSVLTVAFVSSSQARRETDRASRQIENGLYAVQLLSDDLAQAGYFAEFNPNVLNGIYAPTTVPDPCATDLPSLRLAMALPVQGFDNGAGMSACLTSLLSDLRTGTDILVIRRAGTCIRGATGCDGTVAGTPYFQAALCSAGSVGATELNSAAISDFFALDTADANLTKHTSDCTTAAPIHRYRTHIYFVANNDNSGDGIPTLKRAELGPAGFTVVPLVEGIENLQLEYGMDAIAPTNGAPDVFTPTPDGYAGAGNVGAVGNWRNVVAARVYVLARSTEISPGYTDTKTYILGYNTAGSPNSISVDPAETGYRRHVYQAEVRMNNPAGRYLVP
jgi:type IV pilus assembly protein PilW